jgi:hypothetical protein
MGIHPLSYRQVAKLMFTPDMPPITVTIRGLHMYGDVLKYDLDLWLGDGTADDDGYADNDTGVKTLQKRTRIYNIDASFVFI